MNLQYSKVGGPVILMYFRTFRRQNVCKPLLNENSIILHVYVVYLNLFFEL
jgi:hypothetical protein